MFGNARVAMEALGKLLKSDLEEERITALLDKITSKKDTSHEDETLFLDAVRTLQSIRATKALAVICEIVGGIMEDHDERETAQEKELGAFLEK